MPSTLLLFVGGVCSAAPPATPLVIEMDIPMHAGKARARKGCRILVDTADSKRAYRVSIAGKETVLDALASLPGPPITHAYELWVERPSPTSGVSVLPVDWPAIVDKGDLTTNYELLPGDRIYIRRLPKD
jgi:hypothetical protein